MAVVANGKTVVVQEIIGRWSYGKNALRTQRLAPVSVDETIPDYAFYDRLRRGQAAGYTLGGLFARRIERIFAAWVLGGGLDVTLRTREGETLPAAAADYTNARLREFIAGLLDAGQAEDEAEPDRDAASGSILMNVFRDALGLGDQWIFVNPDGSLSIPSPDTVTHRRDPLDYRKLISVTITTYPDPNHTVIDEYRADGRTLIVRQGAVEIAREEYQNLIGRIPVVHVAYGMGSNEIYGHPIHEALLRLYDIYDDVLHKQIDGSKLFGNPIPAFTGMKNIDEVVNVNAPVSTETYLDEEGNTVARTQLVIDENAVMLIGEGGDAKFLAPPVGFTADTKNTLKSLFLLLLDNTGIPEFIWGNEVSSGRSSSETQLDWFVRDIEGQQRDNGGWIVRLCTIWLQTMALTDPGLWVGPLALRWPDILAEDEEIKLKRLEFASNKNLIKDETALKLLNLVEDPATEVEEAQAEADARRDALFPFGDTAGFQAGLRDAEADDGTEAEE